VFNLCDSFQLSLFSAVSFHLFERSWIYKKQYQLFDENYIQLFLTSSTTVLFDFSLFMYNN